jgi:hypothetical protein
LNTLISNQQALQQMVMEGINDIKMKLAKHNKILKQLSSMPIENKVTNNKRKTKEGFSVSIIKYRYKKKIVGSTSHMFIW